MDHLPRKLLRTVTSIDIRWLTEGHCNIVNFQLGDFPIGIGIQAPDVSMKSVVHAAFQLSPRWARLSIMLPELTIDHV